MQEATLDPVSVSLNDERERLSALLERLSSKTPSFDNAEEPDTTEAAGDFEDLHTRLLDEEQEIAVMRSLEAQIAEVDAAVARFASGKYGTCEVCDERIPAARLAVRPESRLCVEDQARMDRSGRAVS